MYYRRRTCYAVDFLIYFLLLFQLDSFLLCKDANFEYWLRLQNLSTVTAIQVVGAWEEADTVVGLTVLN
jgi:hypothetical protein